MKEAAQKIMAMNPDIQITIAGGGSGVGIKQVGEGLVEIGNSGRKPTDEEINRYQLTLYQWAIDGVAPVVNPKNPVKKLTKNQVVDIFSGKIDNWKMLGGKQENRHLHPRCSKRNPRGFLEKGP